MKNILICFALCFFAFPSFGQDFGGILSIELEKKLNKKWGLSFEEEMRLNNHFGDIERFAHTIGVDYKFSKYVKAGAAYSLINKNVHYEKTSDNTLYIKDYWQSRHRVSMFVTGSYKYENFKFSLRERLQYTAWDKKKYKKVDDVKQWTEENEDSFLIRSRLQIAYDKKGFKWAPFASIELFHLLKRDTYTDDNDVEQRENALDEIRFIVGTGYVLNKKNELDIFYRFDNNRNDDDINRIGIGYTFKF